MIYNFVYNSFSFHYLQIISKIFAWQWHSTDTLGKCSRASDCSKYALLPNPNAHFVAFPLTQPTPHFQGFQGLNTKCFLDLKNISWFQVKLYKFASAAEPRILAWYCPFICGVVTFICGGVTYLPTILSFKFLRRHIFGPHNSVQKSKIEIGHITYHHFIRFMTS